MNNFYIAKTFRNSKKITCNIHGWLRKIGLIQEIKSIQLYIQHFVRYYYRTDTWLTHSKYVGCWNIDHTTILSWPSNSSGHSYMSKLTNKSTQGSNNQSYTEEFQVRKSKGIIARFSINSSSWIWWLCSCVHNANSLVLFVRSMKREGRERYGSQISSIWALFNTQEKKGNISDTIHCLKKNTNKVFKKYITML